MGQRGSFWREIAADPVVRAAALYSLVAIGGAIVAYTTIYAGFAGYDDEGTVLITLNAFAHGQPLYTDVFSPYGPFYFEFFGGLAALVGQDFTTDASRAVVIVIWLASSFLLGLACARLTGRLALGVAGMIVAFGVLYALFPEPMHPHGLLVLPGISGAIVYDENDPVPFAGAEQLRLKPEEVAEYEGVVDFIERNHCTTFVSYPNVDSIYLWTDVEPPKPYAPGTWATALDDEEQDRILTQVRASPRPCALRNEAVASMWLGERSPPDTALIHYVFDDFETVGQSGNFELRLPKGGF